MAKRIMVILGVTVTGLALVVGALWAGQRRLIYLPDRGVPTTPAGVEDVVLTTEDGLSLTAWLVRPPIDQDLRRLVVVFPGNAGNRAGRMPLAERLAGEELEVLLVDYRGYGGNDGSPSERGLLLDAEAVGRWLNGQDLDSVVYFGESLGGGPATHLATVLAPTSLVLRSPFTSLPEAAGVHYPFLPVERLLKDEFPVEEWVASVASPVFVVAGSADGIVPFELSARVAEAAGGELVGIEGADHNDAVLAWGPEVIETVVGAAG